jgi:hypothetical protein
VPLTGFETGVVPTDSNSQQNIAVILKYWQFFFENCPAVLAKKINCFMFSRLMLIPWIAVPELVNVAVRICCFERHESYELVHTHYTWHTDSILHMTHST